MAAVADTCLNDSVLSAVLAVSEAAESCEGDTLARLGCNTGAACDALASAVSAATDIVSNAIRDARLRAKRQCALLDKRLEWRFEELVGCSDMLESYERQLCVNRDNFDLCWLEVSLVTAEQLLDEVNPLPCCSSLIFAGDSVPVLSAVADMSHVQEGVDVGYSTVSHPPWLRRGEWNSVTITCRDAFGDAVRVKVEDVMCVFGEGGSCWFASPTCENDIVCLSVAPSTEAVAEVTLYVAIGCVWIHIPLQVRPCCCCCCPRFCCCRCEC